MEPVKKNTKTHCTSPQDIYSIATAFTILIAKEFTQKEIETLINILSLVVSGLSAIVTQQQICDNEGFDPPI